MNALNWFLHLIAVAAALAIQNGAQKEEENLPLCTNSSMVQFGADQTTLELFRPLKIGVEWANTFGLPNCTLATPVQLQFRPPHAAESHLFFAGTQQFEVVHTERLQMGQREFEFGCENVLRPGFYRVQAGNTSSSAWLSISNSSSGPKLFLAASSAIFPACRDDFSLSWALPKCAGLAQKLHFHIRMLAAAVEKAQELVYLEEFPVDVDSAGGNYLKIPCAQFDIIHEHFCFELVSVSKRDRHFQLWARQCVRTEALASRANDDLWEWSEWSEWSSCKCQPSKNDSVGTRRRTRHCRRVNIEFVERTTVRSPTTRAKGMRECKSGEILQKQECEANCSLEKVSSEYSAIYATPVNPIIEPSKPAELGCRCGCRLPNEKAIFFAALCENAQKQQWTLEFDGPFGLRLFLLDQLKAGETLRVIKDAELTIWSNNDFAWSAQWEEATPVRDALIEEHFERSATIELSASPTTALGPIRRGSGVYLEYAVVSRGGPSAAVSSNLLAALMSDQNHLLAPICAQERTKILCATIIGLISLLLCLLVLVLPPLVCVWATKWRQRRRPKMGGRLHQLYSRAPHEDALTNSSCGRKTICAEMLRSDNTQSTRLSGGRRQSSATSAKMVPPLPPQIVEQRSIGIQLSRQSTPRCASRQQRRRPRSNAKRSSGSLESATICDGSNADFWNEDDDLAAQEFQLAQEGRESCSSKTSGLVSSIDIEHIVRSTEAASGDWIVRTDGGRVASSSRDVATQF